MSDCFVQIYFVAVLNCCRMRLVGNFKIKEVLFVRKAKLSDNKNSKKIITVDKVLEFWSDVIKDENTAMSHRIKASELRMKATGEFADKLKAEAPDDASVTIVDDIDED